MNTKLIFRSLALIAVLTAYAALPAYAAIHHHTHHAKKQVVVASTRVRTAQGHLANLGYYKTKIDGIMGPKTKAALKQFQKEHGLKANGVLTDATYKILEDADHPPQPVQPVAAMPSVEVMPTAQVPSLPPPNPKFYDEHRDFYGYVNPAYSNPMAMGPPVVPSRFGRIEVRQQDKGNLKAFEVKLNGSLLFVMDNQTSVIGISKTYTLTHEDAIIFTAYRDGDLVCNYRNYLLTLDAEGDKLHEIANCTRGYQAFVKDDVLNIVFPELDDKRAAGATWRYDHGDLVRL